MAKFCTSCGKELEDDTNFCTNCGTKFIDKKEIKKAEAKLKELTGGFFASSTYQGILKKHNIPLNEGIKIKDEVKNEIKSGKLNGADVENRLIDLLVEYTDKQEKYEEESFKLVDDLFETEEIKTKIEDYDLENENIMKIKKDIKKKITEKKFGSYNEKSMKKDILNELFYEKKHKDESMKKELEENKVKYVENLIKDSYPNAELTFFEKNKVEHIKSKGTYEELKEKLDEISNKIINNRKKVRNYDFACALIEDGGFRNFIDEPLIRRGHAMKAKDIEYYVFVKILEDRLEITGSDIEPPFNLTTNGTKGGDRTLFYNDISNISYSYSDATIFLNLNNKQQIRLKYTVIGGAFKESSFESKSNELKGYYEKLNERFIKSKENKGEKIALQNEEKESNPTDELVKIAELYEKGLLTEDEFIAMKKKLLGL